VIRGDHVHFIDGGCRGYASAATALKAMVARRHPAQHRQKSFPWFPMAAGASLYARFALGKGTGAREICWLNKQRSLLWRQIHVLQRKLAATRFIRW
jgi:hypothetical protein